MFVEPALHRFENVLVLPSGDPALLARGAGVLDGAVLGRIGRVAAQNQSILLGCEGVGEPFSGEANVNVLLHEVAEACLPKRPSAFECEVIGFGSVAVMPAFRTLGSARY
jgi:hypothetical protein